MSLLASLCNPIEQMVKYHHFVSKFSLLGKKGFVLLVLGCSDSGVFLVLYGVNVHIV